MSNNEVSSVSLGLHLNSKPLEQQMGAMQNKLAGAFEGIGRKLGAALGIGLSVKALTDFSKKCLDLGSDLAEVQNVVDVTFSGMSGQVDAFAQNAAISFGLSETMAKQFTGTFGAMAKAFGFTEAQAYDMSTALTGLAGDVASFYNLDQEEAFGKLKAIFTGETEGLKSLGVVMTQTALDQFAMENGFGKTTAAMTEQEKAALRYQFVMDKLSLATGDFARTSDGWANQTRILKLQIESFEAAIGQGLITMLTPAIQTLNSFMGALVKAANTFKSFVYSLFGKKSEDMAAGLGAAMSDAMSGIADSSAGAADGVSGVGDAVKGTAAAIRRSLFGFDQINKLMDQSSGGSSGGGASGVSSALGDTSSALISDAWDAASEGGPLDTIAEKLKDAFVSSDWEEIGRFLGGKINDVVEAIPWDDLGSKFGKGINAIISTEYWKLDETNFQNIGASIAEFVNNTIGNIDFNIAGRVPVKTLISFAEGVESFFGSLNWELIGISIGQYLDGAFDEALKWIAEKDWAELFENGKKAIAAFKNGLESANFEDTHNVLSYKIDKAFFGDSIANWWWGKGEYAGSETIKGLINATEQGEGDLNIAGQNVGSGFLNGVEEFFTNPLIWVEEHIFTPLINAIKRAFGIASPAKEMIPYGEYIGEGLLSGLLNPFKNLKTWVQKNILNKLQSALDKGKELVATVVGEISAVKDKIREKVLAFEAKLTTWRDALVNKVVEFKSKLTTWKDSLTNKVVEFQSKLTTWKDALKDKVVEFQSKLTTWKDDLKDKSVEFQSKLTTWKDSLSDKVLEFQSKLTTWKDALKDKVVSGMTANLTSAKDSIADKTISGITAVMTTLKDKVSNKLVSGVTAEITTARENLASKTIGGMKAQFKDWETAANWAPWSYVKAWFKNYDTAYGWDPWSYIKGWFNAFDQTYTPTINAKANITEAWLSKNAGGIQVKALGGVFDGVKWNPIQRYASGGAPGMGQLFVAREAGPELVGTLGGHTAVMNNDQIVASVSAGVARAMSGLRLYVTNAATPQLAVIGHSTANSERYLAGMAEQAREERVGGANTRMLEKLDQIINLIQNTDPNVYMDGRDVTDRVVRIINQDTQATGRCAIIV